MQPGGKVNAEPVVAGAEQVGGVVAVGVAPDCPPSAVVANAATQILLGRP